MFSRSRSSPEVPEGVRERERRGGVVRRVGERLEKRRSGARITNGSWPAVGEEVRGEVRVCAGCSPVSSGQVERPSGGHRPEEPSGLPFESGFG